MADLIDRDALISTLKDIIADYKEEKSFSTDFAATIVYDILKNCVKAAPTVDAVPVRHGKWMQSDKHGYATIECSECGAVFDQQMIPFKFCPNCGADMREETT